MNDQLNIFLKQTGRSLHKNSPGLLTGLAVAGLFTSVYLAIKATPKALEAVYQEADFRREQWAEGTGESEESYPVEPVLSAWEVVQTTWKFYIPTAVSVATTATAMIMVNSIHSRRSAALAALYSISKTALEEYQEKVRETIGEKKEARIQDEIAQDHVDKNPPTKETVILTGKGDYLCFEDFSKRYFRSDKVKIEKAVNEFNRRLNLDGWLNVNYFYDLIGLEPIELGEEMGWIADRGLLEIRYTSKITKEDEPCIVLEFRPALNHI